METTQHRSTPRRTMPLIMAVGGAQGAHMGAMNLLVVLYMLSLGYSIAWVGGVVAALAVLQVALQFFGGVVSDRFGERAVLAWSFGTVTVATLVFIVSTEAWLFVVAQVAFGGTRAVFYPASQSYASRVNESNRAGSVGRFRGGANLGSAVGPVLGGLLAASGNLTLAFAGAAAIAGMGLVSSLLLPDIPRRSPGRLREALAPAPRLMRSRPLIAVGIHTFVLWSSVGALYSAVTVAFLAESGVSTEANGALGSLVFLTAAGGGFAFGRVMARLRAPAVMVLGALASAASAVGIALSNGNGAGLVPAVAMLGLAMSLMTSLRILLTAEHSEPAERGVANGVVGLYGGVAQLVMPIAYGAVASAAGLQATLLIASAIPLAFAAFVPVLLRWAAHKPARPVRSVQAASTGNARGGTGGK